MIFAYEKIAIRSLLTSAKPAVFSGNFLQKRQNDSVKFLYER